MSSSDRISTPSSIKKDCSVEKALEHAAEYVTSSSKQHSNGDCSVERAMNQAAHFVDTTMPVVRTALESAEQQLSLTDRMTHFVEDNVTAMSIGAMFGGAVATGISIGVMAATSVFVQHVPSFLYKYYSRLIVYQSQHRAKINNDRKSKPGDDGSSSSSTTPVTLNMSSSSSSSLIFLQVSAAVVDGSDAVTTCLDQMADACVDNSPVHRIVAYIVATSGGETGTSSYNNNNNNIREAISSCYPSAAVSIVYVQRLEDPTHVILLDVIASRS